MSQQKHKQRAKQNEPNFKKVKFSLEHRKNTIIALLSAIDTPYAHYLIDKLNSEQVTSIEAPHPDNYQSASDYFADAQAYSLVNKNSFLRADFCLKEATLKQWYKCEATCLETNRRIRSRSIPFRERSVLELARSFCYAILGDLDLRETYTPPVSEVKTRPGEGRRFSSPTAEHVFKPDFGPGVTRYLKGTDANIVRKLGTLPEVTPSAYSVVVKEILDKMPLYAVSSGMVTRTRTTVKLGPQLATLVKHAKFSLVPKNWKIMRPISVEPFGNMLVQKAVGSAIRFKLKNFGLDLNTAPTVHDELARLGSIDGSFATVDLASASDTISTELVRFLLPQDWFDYLNQIRTKTVEMPDGSIVHVEKFSAMGNGFTFELESLIFYSIVLAVRKTQSMENTRVSVFGDDIIVNPKLFPLLQSTFIVCGFTINTEKTFIRGPFRESCGADYFNGQPVTTIKIKDKEEDHVSTLYYYLNRITALSSAYNFGIGCSGRFRTTWENLLGRLPKELRFGGPAYLGDIVIHGTASVKERSKGTSNRYKYRIAVLVKRSRFTKTTNPDILLACATYGIPARGVIPRGSKYTIGRQWQYACIERYAHTIHWIMDT